MAAYDDLGDLRKVRDAVERIGNGDELPDPRARAQPRNGHEIRDALLTLVARIERNTTRFEHVHGVVNGLTTAGLTPDLVTQLKAIVRAWDDEKLRRDTITAYQADVAAQRAKVRTWVLACIGLLGSVLGLVSAWLGLIG